MANIVRIFLAAIGAFLHRTSILSGLIFPFVRSQLLNASDVQNSELLKWADGVRTVIARTADENSPAVHPSELRMRNSMARTIGKTQLKRPEGLSLQQFLDAARCNHRLRFANSIYLVHDLQAIPLLITLIASEMDRELPLAPG